MVDLVVVGLYFAALVWMGWRARLGSPDAYWVAERRYSSLPVAASLVATIFGASSTIGIIGLGYSRGLTGAWWSLVGGLALVPFALFLAGRVRRLEVYTLPDILSRAYGPKVAVVGAGVIALAWCGVVAAQVVAGALLLGGVLGVPFEVALALVAVIFVLYTLLGGQTSVIRTDSLQILLFGGALLTTLGLVLWTGLREGVGVLGGVPAGHLAFPVSPGFGWYQLLVFYPLIVGMPYLVGPDMYSRVLCARDSGAARRASLMAAGLVVPLSFLLALLGVLLLGRFPGLAPEGALPAALTALAPPGLRGLIVVGLLGAVMSSADTTLISASTILSLNVVGPWARLDKPQGLRLTRVFVVVVGIAAWGLAAFQQGIISSLLLAYTVFVGGVALPTLASFWKDRLGVSASGAFWAVVFGGGLAVLGEAGGGSVIRALLGETGSRILEEMLGPGYRSLLPLLVSALVLLVVRPRWTGKGSTRVAPKLRAPEGRTSPGS